MSRSHLVKTSFHADGQGFCDRRICSWWQHEWNNFSSEEFDFLRGRGIRHCFSSVYHSQANELVERFNGVFKPVVQIAVYEWQGIRVAVTGFLRVYHCTPPATVGVAPAILQQGWLPRTGTEFFVSWKSSRVDEIAASACRTKTSFFQTLHRLPLWSSDTLPSATMPTWERCLFTGTRENILALFGPKNHLAQILALFLLKHRQVWNSLKFNLMHPEAAENPTGSRLGILDLTLPSLNRPLQSSAPVSEQRVDCPRIKLRTIFSAEQMPNQSSQKNGLLKKDLWSSVTMRYASDWLFFYQSGKCFK